MNDVAIIIPVFNRKDTTLACLDSIYKYLPSGFVVIVSDAGSTDGTQAAIRQSFPEVILIQGETTDWWTASTNHGIRLAIEQGYKYVLTFNDDNVATPGLFNRLLTTAELHPESIIASVVCYLDSGDKIIFAGRRRSRLTDRFIYLNHKESTDQLEGGIREVDLLHGMCTLFPVSVFKAVGYFDVDAFPHLFADDDLTLKAKDYGYYLLVDQGAIVLNDHTLKGLTPYGDRLGPADIFRLLVSRKSVFQLVARSRFLWRHRRSTISYLITLIADYIRLLFIIVARWIFPVALYDRIERLYLRIRSI